MISSDAVLFYSGGSPRLRVVMLGVENHARMLINIHAGIRYA